MNSTIPMTVLVTGARGQLGQELTSWQLPGARIIGCDRNRLDIADLSQCRDVLAELRRDGNVVHDQVGSPTFTYDLSRILIELVQTEAYGIYHDSNTGTCSWYEFAKAIFELAGISIQVNPCSSAEFPSPASRPAYSVMDHSAIRWNGLRDLRHWRNDLKDFLERLNSK